MAEFTANDVRIPNQFPNQGDAGGVLLWRVRGLDDWYPTKITAEAAARNGFPHEDIHRRYARLSYKHFFPAE